MLYTAVDWLTWKVCHYRRAQSIYANIHHIHHTHYIHNVHAKAKYEMRNANFMLLSYICSAQKPTCETAYLTSYFCHKYTTRTTVCRVMIILSANRVLLSYIVHCHSKGQIPLFTSRVSLLTSHFLLQASPSRWILWPPLPAPLFLTFLLSFSSFPERAKKTQTDEPAVT